MDLDLLGLNEDNDRVPRGLGEGTDEAGMVLHLCPLDQRWSGALATAGEGVADQRRLCHLSHFREGGAGGGRE